MDGGGEKSSYIKMKCRWKCLYKVNSNIKRTLTISMMNDVVYWMTIAAFISGSLVAVLPFTKTASILSSALVGSFIFIIPIDHYIGSSLKYILVNFVRRAYVDGFNLAVLNFPFQVKFFLFIYAGFLRLLKVS